MLLTIAAQCWRQYANWYTPENFDDGSGWHHLFVVDGTWSSFRGQAILHVTMGCFSGSKDPDTSPVADVPTRNPIKVRMLDAMNMLAHVDGIGLHVVLNEFSVIQPWNQLETGHSIRMLHRLCAVRRAKLVNQQKERGSLQKHSTPSRRPVT